MFFKEPISHYILLQSKYLPKIFVDTKNSYEFVMAALFAYGMWYVIVENPDWSRMQNIDEIVHEEYDAAIEGWCVLRKSQGKVGASILPFNKGEEEYNDITYQDGSDNYWLLKIKPNDGSRLLKFY